MVRIAPVLKGVMPFKAKSATLICMSFGETSVYGC